MSKKRDHAKKIKSEDSRLTRFNQITREIASELGLPVTAVQFCAKGNTSKVSQREADLVKSRLDQLAL